jgi:hypothetical protein
VDLTHQPLGYESNSAAQAGQPQAAKRKQTLRSALPELPRFAPRSRTEHGDRKPLFRLAPQRRRRGRPWIGSTHFFSCVLISKQEVFREE